MKKYMRVGIGIIAVIILNIFLICVGIQKGNNFFNINVMSVLSLDVSVILSVYVVQSLVSKRRRFDFMVKMLEAIVEDLRNPELLNHQKDEKAQLLQRYISNRLKYIESACPKEMKADLHYIREKYESIQNFYGDHKDGKSDDLYYEREKTNIVTKIAKVQLSLYGFDV